MTDQITISVDFEVANAYRLASDLDRRKKDGDQMAFTTQQGRSLDTFNVFGLR